MCLFIRRMLVTACAAWAMFFALAAESLAANWFLAPNSYTDISQFNSINYFSALAYDPNIPLQVGDTVSPVPTGFAAPRQNGFVQALPGGQGGSMNEYSLSPTGLSLTIGLVAPEFFGIISTASTTGMITFGTFDGLPMPYSLADSFVAQTSSPDGRDGFGTYIVQLSDLTRGGIIYYHYAQGNGVSNVIGNPSGTLPADIFRLTFQFYINGFNDGAGFGNGVLNLALEQGDFNRDGHSDAGDVSTMLGAFADLNAYKLQHNLSAADLVAIGDANRDGKVTNADIQSLLDLIASSGSGSVAAVPEPNTFILAVIGLVLLSMIRRVVAACHDPETCQVCSSALRVVADPKCQFLIPSANSEFVKNSIGKSGD